MLRSLATITATTLFTTATFAANVGEPAPAFKGIDVISGKEVSNATLKGKTAVLEWTNPECPFVKKFYDVGAMQKFQDAAVKDDVVWVSINSSAVGKEGYLKDAAEAKASIAEHNTKSSAYLLDPTGTIGKAFGAKTTPHMFIINTDGTLVYQGAIDSKSSADSADIDRATNYVTETLTALKAGTAIKTASTKSYGCFVKY